MDQKFKRNKFGISIKKCCASCEHMAYDNGALHICLKGYGHIRSSSVCNDWSMAPRMQNAGKGGGRIKKLDYIRYVTGIRTKEAMLINAGKMKSTDVESIERISERYELEHGSSRYIK